MKKVLFTIIILSTLGCGINKDLKEPYWHDKTEAQKKEYKKERRKEIRHDLLVNTIGITVWLSSIMIINKVADNYKP